MLISDAKIQKIFKEKIFLTIFIMYILLVFIYDFIINKFIFYNFRYFNIPYILLSSSYSLSDSGFRFNAVSLSNCHAVSSKSNLKSV